MRSYRQSGCLHLLAPPRCCPSPAPGAAQSNAELMDIIRQQQRQIDELSRKVDALQVQARQATEKADTAAQTAQKVEEQSRPQGRVGARADLLEQGWQLVRARARPPDGGRRRSATKTISTRTTTPPKCAPRASASRAISCRAGSTSAWRPTSPTAPSISRTPTSSTAASSSSPPTSGSASTRRRTRSSS